ncbi:LysR substrate-binding domain-containing protein [Paraburkholderia mimosarum]|uniref:LysR substrate-binding domain-containing protein n=1 Tax=Paraburkholderia mimosarum TaxID=312026 RepID=UPI0013780882
MSLIPCAVERFRAVCPDVSLRIDTRHTDDLLAGLLTRDLDLAVAIDPPSRPGIERVELARSRVVMVAARGHNDRELPSSLEAFVANENCISIGTEDPLGEVIGSALAAHGLTEYAPSIEVCTWYLARSFAARGLGHVLLDELTARAPGEPVTISPITQTVSVGIFALWSEGHPHSHAREVFIDTLRIPIEGTLPVTEAAHRA